MKTQINFKNLFTVYEVDGINFIGKIYLFITRTYRSQGQFDNLP